MQPSEVRVQGWVVYVIAGVSVVVLAAAGGLLGRLVWRGIVHRRVVRLAGHFEAVAAGERNLRAVVTLLSEAPDEELVAFASDPSHEDRHSLNELAGRMRAQSEELIALALPKPLWGAADLLADAAWRVGREAERAANGAHVAEVFEHLAAVDLLGVREAVSAAEQATEELRRTYDVEETVVYGGGLYI